MVTSFGTNFFAPILGTVEALAPWIVVVAGAIAACHLVMRLLDKIMGSGVSAKYRIKTFGVYRDVTFDKNNNSTVSSLKNVDEDDLPLTAFDSLGEYERTKHTSYDGTKF